MKRLFIILIVFICSCSKVDEYVLTVSTNSPNPFYIFEYKDGQFNKSDSSFNSSGKHTFNFNNEKHHIYWCGESTNNCFVFIAKPIGKCEVNVNEFDVTKMKVDKDSTNILLHEFFQKRVYFIETYSAAIESEKNEILDSFYTYIKSFIHAQKDSPVILMTLNDLTLNPIQFLDEIFIIKKVIEDKYNNPSYLKEVENLIQLAQQQERNNNLQIQREKEAKERRKALGLEIGQIAPEIIMKSPDGNTYKLSDLKDQIVLLDFWASWCRPCRAENPNVVQLYEQYNKEGFTVFSVSLDQKLELWEAAIEKDRLIWPYHVSDLNGWYSSAAKQYGVESIPSTFLLDKGNKIAAYNLKGEALSQKVKELLNG